MTRTINHSRTTARSAALGVLVIALAAGCGGASDEETDAPQDGGTGQSTNDAGDGDDGASDAGGDDSAASDGGSGAADPGAGAGTQLPESADLATDQLPIAAEQAVGIAVDTVGGGETVSVEIDHDDDRWEWEISVALDGREHDLGIDAATGEVTEHDQDDDDADEPAVDVTAPLAHSEAIEIALGEAPGRVTGWDLDSDDGRIRYQIEIERSEGDKDVEVEIDVETREVRIDD